MSTRPADRLAVILCNSSPAGDPRPKRMLQWLAPHFKLATVSTSEASVYNARPFVLPQVHQARRVHRITSALSYLLHGSQYRQVHKLASGVAELEPSLLCVHDLILLPLAVSIRSLSPKPCRIFFDAREYYPRQFEDRLFWRLFHAPVNRYISRKYIDKTDAMVSVSPWICAEYSREYKVPCGFLPSYPNPVECSPSTPHQGQIRMIHHGSASRSRRLEVMIDAMRLLPSHFTLDLILVGSDTAYINRLRLLASGLADRVRFLPPVPFSNLVSFTNQYDLGFCILPPSSVNLLHSLPNKFFEFVQARLGVIIGPSPDMAKFVQTYGFGIIASDFTAAAAAAALRNLTLDDVERMKTASHAAAKVLNASTLETRVLRMALDGCGAEAFP